MQTICLIGDSVDLIFFIHPGGRQLEIDQAKVALEQAELKVGKDSIEASYKWDALADAYKEKGKLLEAANASAKAKVIRAAHFAKEAEIQRQEIGDVSRKKDLTAVVLLKFLYRFAIGSSALILLSSIFLPSSSLGSEISRELFGSGAAATLVQLLLYPIKSIPRFMKFIIVLVLSGAIWTFLSKMGN